MAWLILHPTKEICKACEKSFLKTKHAQKYCDDPSCIKERKRVYSSNARNNNKSPRIKKEKKCRCGNKHNNYYDLCPTCYRDKVDSIDANYLYMSCDF